MSEICFVLMPFGEKKDQKGRKLNFDLIYSEIIRPAIIACDVQPLRADEELLFGNIHKPMFERLVLCEYAIADLTSLNPNVFYELGLRHAIKPYTTLPISAFDTPLPFDIHSDRTLPYHINDEGELTQAEEDRTALIRLLKTAVSKKAIDSPVFQLLDGWEVTHTLSHEKTDVFRERVDYESTLTSALVQAVEEGSEALDRFHETITPLSQAPTGIVIDYFLALRGISEWQKMIATYEEMDAPIQQLKMVQEQLALATNRAGESMLNDHEFGSSGWKDGLTFKKRAIKILTALIEKHGHDPETDSILGRVYKDLYERYSKRNDNKMADQYLNKAISYYKQGFDADWRDAYPGVNLITLLNLKGDDALLDTYLPVVKFAAQQKLTQPRVDYWDYATVAELAILAGQYSEGDKYMREAIGLMPDSESFMLESTLKNLTMVRDLKLQRNQDAGPLTTLLNDLKQEDIL